MEYLFHRDAHLFYRDAARHVATKAGGFREMAVMV